jgi:hypothetical protein
MNVIEYDEPVTRFVREEAQDVPVSGFCVPIRTDPPMKFMTPVKPIIENFCCYCKQNGHSYLGKMEPDGKVTCPVLLNTECQTCFTKGHTTTTCPKTDILSITCLYCKVKGHAKNTCPVLGAKICSYCGDKGHVYGRCFLRMNGLPRPI